MKLIHQDYTAPLIEDSNFSAVVIENEHAYAGFFRDLHRSMQGEGQKLFLFENGAEKKLSRVVEWVQHNWLLEFGDRKMITKAIAEIQYLVQNSGVDTDIMSRWYEIHDMLQAELNQHSHLELSDQVWCIGDVLKAFGASFIPLDESSYIDRLIEYMTCKIEYDHRSLFIFDQVLAYLSCSELHELCRFCQREDVAALVVESIYSDKIKSLKDRVLIIDQDLCEILINAP